ARGRRGRRLRARDRVRREALAEEGRAGPDRRDRPEEPGPATEAGRVLMVDANAYIQRPLWARWLQRVLYVIWYGLMVVAGYAAWSGLGFPAHEAGAVIMFAAAVALFGAASGYYHGELMALPPLMAALSVVVVWLQLPPQ